MQQFRLSPEGHLPTPTPPLRAPLGGRDELLLPKRPRDGVLRRLRDAHLPGRSALAEELGGSRGGDLWCGASGGADRLQQDVPGRALLQRRHRGIRRGRGMAQCPDPGAETMRRGSKQLGDEPKSRTS